MKIIGYCLICRGIIQPLNYDPPIVVCMVCGRRSSINTSKVIENTNKEQKNEIESFCKYCKRVHLLKIYSVKENLYMLHCEIFRKTFEKKL